MKETSSREEIDKAIMRQACMLHQHDPRLTREEYEIQIRDGLYGTPEDKVWKANRQKELEMKVHSKTSKMTKLIREHCRIDRGIRKMAEMLHVKDPSKTVQVSEMLIRDRIYPAQSKVSVIPSEFSDLYPVETPEKDEVLWEGEVPCPQK